MAILLIDKPRGMSSFDVLRKLRRDFVAGHLGHKAPKMGHAGTLDPRATGLLIVATDTDTKRLNDSDLVGLNKEYVADIIFGVKTDSGDLDGAIIERIADNALSKLTTSIATAESLVREVLLQMKNENGGTGRMILPVSLFSAMKRGGRPLYEYARAGKDVVAPKREMRVIEAELLGMEIMNLEGKNLPVAKVRFLVESGTYIRSLAEEVGRRLGMLAALAELRRTKVGDFRVEDAEKI